MHYFRSPLLQDASGASNELRWRKRWRGERVLDVISGDWALSYNFSCQRSTSTISTNRYFFKQRLSWKFAFHMACKYLAPSRDITHLEKYFRAVALPFIIIAWLCLHRANVDDYPRLKGCTVELWNRCDIKCSQEHWSRTLPLEKWHLARITIYELYETV
jgi:hypothetical protein